MSLQRVVTEISWEPGQGFDTRASSVFSDQDKIRLDPRDHQVKLTLQANHRYPLDQDLSVRSRVYEPGALLRLLMIQVYATIPTDEDGLDLGSVGLRLYDGTDERYWDGGAWSVAGAGDWNTEAEVNQSIAQFDASARKFAVVVNLLSTDDRYTPAVTRVHVLWEGSVDWVQDAVLDSFTQTVQEEATYASDVAYPPLETAATELDLDDYVDEASAPVVGVEAAYDHDADPTHRVDLLDSYDDATHVVTFSSVIPLGNRPYLRLVRRAAVAWDTQQDFSEVGALPQVVLGDASSNRSARYPFGSAASVVRKDTGAAVQIPAPYRMTYAVSVEVRTDRSRDQQRLLETLLRVFSEGPSGEAGPFLRSRATDRRYRMQLLEEFSAVEPTINDLADVRSFRSEVRISDVCLDLAQAVDTYAVQTLILKFRAASSAAEQKAAINETPVELGGVEPVEVSEA